MNDILTDKNHSQVISRIPFLSNFPFPEFDMQFCEVSFIKASNTGIIPTPPVEAIAFKCLNRIEATINVFESEIWLLHGLDISEHLKSLNEMVSTINHALSSSEIIEKRDAILFCEKWFSKFKQTNVQIGSSTFSDIISIFMKNSSIEEIVKITNIINQLHERKGVIILDQSQEKLLLNYYQFQLIYFKLVTGIIIAAKTDF